VLLASNERGSDQRMRPRSTSSKPPIVLLPLCDGSLHSPSWIVLLSKSDTEATPTNEFLSLLQSFNITEA